MRFSLMLTNCHQVRWIFLLEVPGCINFSAVLGYPSGSNPSSQKNIRIKCIAQLVHKRTVKNKKWGEGKKKVFRQACHSLGFWLRWSKTKQNKKPTQRKVPGWNDCSKNKLSVKCSFILFSSSSFCCSFADGRRVATTSFLPKAFLWLCSETWRRNLSITP